MIPGMRRYTNPRGTLLFVILAVGLMILTDFFFGGLLEPKAPVREPAPVEEIADLPEPGPGAYDPLPVAVEKMGPPERFGPPGRTASFPSPEAARRDAGAAIAVPVPLSLEEPQIVPGHPKIAIIIDDMGVDRRRSREIIAMEIPLTLAFLPYAAGVGELAHEAGMAGHELMIHMPMEAVNGRLDLGSIALREGMDPAEIDAQMEKAFEAFAGYKGLNNHMGSRLTGDAQAMARVMQALGRRGLYFIDSKTIGDSVAAGVAWAHGLPAAERDVFLDHEDSDAFVRKALHEVEAVARRKGYAIAIGHPKDVTIRGLKAWAAGAQERGYVLVHASALVRKASGQGKGAAGPILYGPWRSQSPAPPRE